jgi:hypothetical protein
MRGVVVKVLVCCESLLFFFLVIEHTSTGSPSETFIEDEFHRGSQARTVTGRSRGLANRRRELAASCSPEPMAPGATSIRAGGNAPDTRDSFVKPGSERPFYTAVHTVNPVQRYGRSHQLIGPTTSVVPSTRD